MLASAVTTIVRFCTRFPWSIIVLALCGAAACAVYTVSHFAITTDIDKLISPNLDWRQREAGFERAFPGHFHSTLVVVDAPTAEDVARASAELTRRLASQPKFFKSVEDMAGSEFFRRNGLLFQPAAEVQRGIGHQPRIRVNRICRRIGEMDQKVPPVALPSHDRQ